ncbi:MAG: hypothetical protein HQK83_04820 [Fibrobacteria bacterium]|nr:hypothetical protein [Fibrobacteria bacterium]
MQLAYDTIDGNYQKRIPMDRKDTLLLNVRLENVGDENALSVICSLFTIDPYITISNPIAGFNNLKAGGDTLNLEPFKIEVKNMIPPAHNVQFLLSIKDS